MEMDRLHRHVVDLRLRLPEPLKYRARPLLHRLRQSALPDHLQDLGQMPSMLVLVLVLMAARVDVRVHDALTRCFDMHMSERVGMTLLVLATSSRFIRVGVA